MIKTWISIGLASLCTLPLSAADLNGNWNLNGDLAGQPVAAVCTLKQDASKLTGICKGESGGTPLTGEISGKKITFTYERDHEGSHYTMDFSGTLETETSMKGTIDVSVAERDGSSFMTGEFTAKKQ